MREIPVLAIVVPCFNEEQILPVTVQRLAVEITELTAHGKVKPNSFILFVDDGSTDRTWDLISDACIATPAIVRGISLARNFGHQSALLCGLDYATDKCDAVVTIDADLQDDVAKISEMIDEFFNGAEIVLGVRRSRKSDTWFKRNAALSYYKLLRLMSIFAEYNHADFRLMSASALRHFSQYSEANLFLRAMPQLLHNRVAKVYYDRAPRAAGKTHYPFRKQLALAWSGITAFSTIPLRIVTIIGGIVFLVSFAMSVYILFAYLSNKVVPGWSSTVIPMYLLGGLIMLSLGVIGEYLGKVYTEVKRRPRYLVDEILNKSREHI